MSLITAAAGGPWRLVMAVVVGVLVLAVAELVALMLVAF